MSYLSPSGIQVANGNMSTIVGANTTGIQLVAAPGSGLLILVHYIWLNIKNGSTPWTGVGNAWLIYGNTGNDTTNLASPFLTNTIPGGTASTNYIAGVPGSIGSDWLGSTVGTTQRVSSANSTNKAVCFTCSNAVIAGNGSIDWRIWYSIISAA